MILYYRKVTLISLDYREEIDRQTRLAWCEPVEGSYECVIQHLSYEHGETFEAVQKRILDALGADSARDQIQICQCPPVTRRQNLNPHGLS